MSDQKEKTETLNDMLVSLRVIERDIDESSEITHEMCEAHFSQLKKIDEKVDRLLNFLDIAKRNSALYYDRAKEIEARAKFWDRTVASLEKYAMYLVDNFPDVQWRGTDRSFTKRINQPSLIVPWKTRYSNENVIPTELVNMVPEKYRKEVTIFVLDTANVKNDLKAGDELNFAKLERKPSLKITAKLKGDIV